MRIIMLGMALIMLSACGAKKENYYYYREMEIKLYQDACPPQKQQAEMDEV